MVDSAGRKTLASRHRAGAIIGAVVIVAGGATANLLAQPARHTPTTLAALVEYPSFFHRLPVIIRVAAEGDLRDVFVTDGTYRQRALNVPPPVAGTTELLEIEGTFWDVGRLSPDDPNLPDPGLRQLSERLLGKPWPSSGELTLLVANNTRRADAPDLVSAVTIRDIVLQPTHYLDQTVIITGRFRGRNLYGDLPEAPGISRDDFVMRSGDASVWVVGKEPRGRGFRLDVMARVDTGRWLQVTGAVSGTNHLIEITANEIEEIDRPVVTGPSPPVASARETGPPAEVIFSAPTQDDTAVALDAPIRFQFSRDMDPESFEGNVTAAYLGADQTAPEGDLELSVDYRARNRVLNVQFTQPLLPYRPVVVTLGDGINATDGATLIAYTLRFATGGS